MGSLTTPPPLALALAATASAQLRLDDADRFGASFVSAVAAMDAADRAYRGAVEESLPPEPGREILAAMAAFRERVRLLREEARRAIDAYYRRAQRSYGAFDPLDPYQSSPSGLSHVDGMRIATVADDARAQVDALRSRVNAEVARQLDAAQIEVLIAAKRRRREVFAAALRESLEAALAPHPAVSASEIGKTVDQLTSLADGWY
jgi:hypothetical protein